jgi:small ubiquitin-related modifier
MAKAKARTSARTKQNATNNKSDDDEEAATASAAVAPAEPAKTMKNGNNNKKKRKAKDESDNEERIGKQQAAVAEREEDDDRAPQPRRANDREDDVRDGRGGGDDDDDDNDQHISIKIPKRTSLFSVPDSWWMVDLHALPAPKQGATPLVLRCMRELRWSEAKSRSVLQAYRQFLHVKVAKQDWNAEILSPSVDVDQMWHQHVLDNLNYAHDCQLLCGHFVRHDPDGGLDVVARINRLDATRQALLGPFGGEDYEGVVDTSATGPWKEVFALGAESDEEAGTESSSGPPAAAAAADTAQASDDGDSSARLRVCVRDQNGEVATFLVRRTTCMRNLFAAYAQRNGVCVGLCRFLLDGYALRGHETPSELELEDGDQLDVLLVLRGC